MIRASWETVEYFFAEPELIVGKEVLSVDKRCQSDGYEAFE